MLTLVRRCPNVRHLSIGNSNLDLTPQGAQALIKLCPLMESLDLEMYFRTYNLLKHTASHSLPKLKKIKINHAFLLLNIQDFDNFFANQSALEQFECKNFLLNGNLLRRSQCSSLTHFHMVDIFDGSGAMNVLIKNCKHSLQNLTIGFLFEDSEKSLIPQIFTQFQNLTFLSFEIVYSVVLLDLPVLPRLKHISLKFKKIKRNEQLAFNVISFFKSYKTKLKSLRLANESLLEQIVPILPNLRSLDIGNLYFWKSYWSLLTTMKKLECLTIFRNTDFKNFHQTLNKLTRLKRLKLDGCSDVCKWQMSLCQVRQSLQNSGFDRKLIVEGDHFGRMILDCGSINEM